MMLPLAKELATHYTVICVDTPGYGLSDGFNKTPTSLENYTTIFNELFDELNIGKLSIYGSATGAQIAIRYALMYPERIAHIFLDNAAHFEDDLSDAILEHYFPDLSPQQDGSHLPILWNMVSNMFCYFPWCFQTEEYKLDKPQLPAVVLNAIALDFLIAGEHYYCAYKLAFKHEQAKFVQELKVPTSIFNWKGSIVHNYIEALVAFDLPKNISVVEISGDVNIRNQKMAAYINDKASQFPLYHFQDSLGKRAVENNLQIPESLVNELPPEAKSDGLHLTDAWQRIKEHQPNASPETIQQQLIQWYIKT